MVYGCIAKHLKHSFSKEIHSLIGNYKYDLVELNEEELCNFLRDKNFSAVNVTIPYKTEVIKFLDIIDDEAQKIGAVNTIVNKNGKLYGYNTDYYGFKNLLKKYKIDVCGKTVLVLGSGGTSKTVNAVLSDLNAKAVTVSRNGPITYDEAYKQYANADVIVNTTPCGMFPNIGDTPINIERFINLSAVVDVIYNPIKTKLIIKAENKGIKTASGLYMLVSQAVRASEIFTADQKYKNGIEDEIYLKILNEKQNIIFSGMPSSGKTTIGKKYSEMFCRNFYDIDEIIVKEQNMSIERIFAEYGESYFRKLEKNVVKRLSELNSSVISCGGGTVLDEENVITLKQNGKICFLDRRPELLLLNDSRPLAKNTDDIGKLFAERYGIYKKTCDFSVTNNGMVDEVICKIRKEFQNENIDN